MGRREEPPFCGLVPILKPLGDNIRGVRHQNLLLILIKIKK
jgi:hypothetical protein